jgi:hypothetical protein
LANEIAIFGRATHLHSGIILRPGQEFIPMPSGNTAMRQPAPDATATLLSNKIQSLPVEKVA